MIFIKGRDWDPVLNAKEKEELRIQQENEANEQRMYEKSKKQKFVPRNNYQHKVSQFIWFPIYTNSILNILIEFI